MNINVEIDLEELAENLWDHDTAMAFIQAIDRRIADYEFSYELAKWLISELKNEEDFDINDLL